MTRFKVFRFDPAKGETPWYETYEIVTSPSMRILDCINQIREAFDPSISFRYSCGHGICGSCGMTINGLASLGCQKLVKHYDKFPEIKLEPLGFYPVVKDLVVDMEPFFERMRSIHPENWGRINPVEVSRQLHQSQEEHESFVEAIKCIMCGSCTAQCPIIRDENPVFIGPAAILRAKRYIFDTRMKDVNEREKIISAKNGVWSCDTRWLCTRVCPKGIRVTKNILDLKATLNARAKNPWARL
jgi:succinate dehydrogenase / fumarate reductase iron-sulfur subunit